MVLHDVVRILISSDGLQTRRYNSRVLNGRPHVVQSVVRLQRKRRARQHNGRLLGRHRGHGGQRRLVGLRRLLRGRHGSLDSGRRGCGGLRGTPRLPGRASCGAAARVDLYDETHLLTSLISVSSGSLNCIIGSRSSGISCLVFCNKHR